MGLNFFFLEISKQDSRHLFYYDFFKESPLSSLVQFFENKYGMLSKIMQGIFPIFLYIFSSTNQGGYFKELQNVL